MHDGYLMERDVDAIGGCPVYGIDAFFVLFEAEGSMKAERMTGGALFSVRRADDHIKANVQRLFEKTQTLRPITIVIRQEYERSRHAKRSSSTLRIMRADGKNSNSPRDPFKSRFFGSAPGCAMLQARMSQRKPPGRTQIYGSPEDDADDGVHISGALEADSPPPRRDPVGGTRLDAVQRVATEELRLTSGTREEIARAIEVELGRCGHPGKIRIDADMVYLHHGEVNLNYPLGSWASSWPRIDDQARQKHVSALARRISQSRNLGPTRSPRIPIVVDPRLLAVAVVLIISGIYYLVFSQEHEAPEGRTAKRRGSFEGSATKESVAASGTDPAHRTERVCAATMTRVFRGGSVTIADVDGWIVEIALMGARGKPTEWQPEILQKYLEAPNDPKGSRFIWKEEPGLAPLDTSDTLVKARHVDVSDGSESRWSLVLSFGGTLVDPYFQEASRNKYYHIAHSLSDDLNAELGALYASCQGNPTHALGSWFRGRDAAGAATSLMYFMGMYASPSHIGPAQYLTPGSDGATKHETALFNIGKNSASVNRKALSGVVGEEGGMAFGAVNSPVTITFPFRDGNRASRASRTLARLTGLSP
jgi:hypothetical protein